MSAATSAVVLAKTLTVSASGVETIEPIKSSSVIKNLSLIVIPHDSEDSNYEAEVKLNDVSLESHSFPTEDDRTIAVMNYKDTMFPPSLNGKNVPAFVSQGKIRSNISFSLILTNNKTSNQDFKIYAVFEEFDSVRESPV